MCARGSHSAVARTMDGPRPEGRRTSFPEYEHDVATVRGSPRGQQAAEQQPPNIVEIDISCTFGARNVEKHNAGRRLLAWARRPQVYCKVCPDRRRLRPAPPAKMR